MNLNGILGTLAQLFAKTADYPAIEAERESAGRLRIRPGQQIQAEVEANLPGQRSLVRIAGELMKMALPVQVRPGDRLQMTFLGEEPRPTFSLSKSANGNTSVSLSSTSKLLGMLTRDGMQQQQAPGSPRMNLLLPAPPADTTLLASRLREALTLNGVFHEHQSAQPDKPVGPAAAETPSTPREQQHSAPSGQVVWQGEVWPDQQMKWAVGEREAGPDENDAEKWETTLRLELPKLGEVNAVLTLAGNGLHLRIGAETEAAADAMREERQSLEDAMTESGVLLTGLIITNEQNGQEQ